MPQQQSLYKTKFRVENLIYEEILSPSQFEELRIRGMQSAVVRTLVCNSFTSAVVGHLKHKVEIMSVIPHDKPVTEQVQVDLMETEVCNYIILFQ